MRRALSLLAIVAAVAALWLPVSQALEKVPLRDFAPYWAAAVLLPQNPYDPQDVYEMEVAAGADTRTPLIMRNPPWALLLVAPLRFLPLPAARTLWFFLSVGGIAWSAVEIWRHYRRRRPALTALLVALFLPVAALLLLGQITWVMLAGVALFLRAMAAGRLGLAGAALALLTVKPHLVLPVLVALLVWSAHRREGRVLLGMAGALAAASAVTLLCNPQIFGQYVAYTRGEDFGSGAIQTLGGHLMRQTGWSWMRWAPAVGAVLWALWFGISRRSGWEWKESLPPLITAGVVAAPYGFTFDQVLLLAAFIPAVAVAHVSSFISMAALVNFSVLVPMLVAGLPDPRAASTTAAAWGIVFVHAWMRRSRRAAAGPSAAG